MTSGWPAAICARHALLHALANHFLELLLSLDAPDGEIRPEFGRYIPQKLSAQARKSNFCCLKAIEKTVELIL